MTSTEAETLLGIPSPSDRHAVEEAFAERVLICTDDARHRLVEARRTLLVAAAKETKSDQDHAVARVTERAATTSDRRGQLTGDVLLNRYEVGRLLGAGGMGEVYEAFDRVRGDTIAIKRLLPTLMADPEACERFRLEARISSNLSHPGIVRVYDVHDAEGITFITMELLAGSNLREEIQRRQIAQEEFSVVEVSNWGTQLCHALEHAHGQMVHRDIKPENIWLCTSGAVKLMDFGIAKLLRSDQLMSTGVALGTISYMAPEQLHGRNIDEKADQYALAATLYELLTGMRPQGAVKPPRVLRPVVPRKLSNAIMKGLAAESEQRFPSVSEFAKSLHPTQVKLSPSWGVGIVSVIIAALIVGTLSLPKPAQKPPLKLDTEPPTATGAFGGYIIRVMNKTPEAMIFHLEFQGQFETWSEQRNIKSQATGEWTLESDVPIGTRELNGITTLQNVRVVGEVNNLTIVWPAVVNQLPCKEKIEIASDTHTYFRAITIEVDRESGAGLIPPVTASGDDNGPVKSQP